MYNNLYDSPGLQFRVLTSGREFVEALSEPTENSTSYTASLMITLAGDYQVRLQGGISFLLMYRESCNNDDCRHDSETQPLSGMIGCQPGGTIQYALPRPIASVD